jgi:hypothetical protein
MEVSKKEIKVQRRKERKIRSCLHVPSQGSPAASEKKV